MTINLRVPKTENELKPRISVVGVGGAGGNAVNNMIRSSLQGVEFIAANTDAQALMQNLAERKIQLGVNINRGLGAGAKPEVGKAAAEESIDEIIDHIQGSNMCFITAGMGGGTGSGAAPVIARASRELGILTVGVVTKPFTFEGAHRMRLGENAIEELQQYVDTLIVIPNQNLFRIANERTTFADAFKMADDVLYSGVRSVTDLITMPGLINLDFADIQTVMAEMGKAMMGTGEAEGDRRALDASEAAINNPLLDDISMKGARAVLINITGGLDMTLFEVDEAANRIRSEVDPDANIIFGAFFDEKLAGRMRISIVAAGMDALSMKNNIDQRAMSNPFGIGLRPSKVVPHADIIATARRPVQQQAPQAVATPPAPPSYSSRIVPVESPSASYPSTLKTESAIRTETASSASAQPSGSQSADANTSPSAGFIPPKPIIAEPSPETVTLTDRIITGRSAESNNADTSATPSATATAETVAVDLKQDRPMERAMNRPSAAPAASLSSSPSSYTAPSSRPSTAANTTTGHSAPPRTNTSAATASTARNSSDERATNDAPAIKPGERMQRRGPGLFERMMGGVLGSARDDSSSSAAATRVEPTLLKIDPSQSNEAKPADAKTSLAKNAESLATGNVPSKPADNDDLLDIPAFLRRGGGS